MHFCPKCKQRKKECKKLGQVCHQCQRDEVGGIMKFLGGFNK